VLFAFGLLAIGERGKPVLDLLGATQQIVFKIVGYIMWLAPLGAMGAIGFTVARFGVNSLISLGALVAEFYLTCALFIVLILWPIAWWNGISLFKLASYFRTELLIVIGTSSSESVFPQLVKKLEALGCEESIVGLVLPTGYAFNHDGTCLYFAAAPIFLAQAVGIDMTLAQQLGLLGVLLVTSKGGAGVAGSAIVVLVSTLAATDAVPVAAVGIILGVHRLMSSAFVSVNVLWQRAGDHRDHGMGRGGRSRENNFSSFVRLLRKRGHRAFSSLPIRSRSKAIGEVGEDWQRACRISDHNSGPPKGPGS